MSGKFKAHDKIKAIENIFTIFAFNLMMKQFFSILLAFILLASHSYLTIGTHFCGGEAVETKILVGNTHLSCGMMDMEETCKDSENSSKNKTSLDNTPCCENQYHTIQPTEDFIQDATQITFNVEFAVAFIYSTLYLDLFPNSTQKFYLKYHSPPIEKDIQVLFQTYLI